MYLAFKLLWNALSWNFTQRRMVIAYRCFGTYYLFHLQGSSNLSQRWDQIGCPETSVRDYYSALRKIPEESRSHFHHGRKLETVQTDQNYVTWLRGSKSSFTTNKLRLMTMPLLIRWKDHCSHGEPSATTERAWTFFKSQPDDQLCWVFWWSSSVPLGKLS